jgi:molybdopterin/thiamine biosynthesis adenylyltransferase
MGTCALRHDRLLQPNLRDDVSVKLIGLGGVGSIVARYGALFLASMGVEARLVLIDGDTFEASNSTRVFFGAFGNKAAVAHDELLHRFAETNLSLLAIEEYVTPDNIGRLIQEGDLVLLAVDNHATRKLINDHCGRLRDVCLISGGNDGVERDQNGGARHGTYGNVQIYLRRDGQDDTQPLTHHHPEIQQPTDRLPSDRSCTELLASVPQILFTNLAVASAILNAFWLHLCGALHYTELCFDIGEGLMRPIAPLLT